MMMLAKEKVQNKSRCGTSALLLVMVKLSCQLDLRDSRNGHGSLGARHLSVYITIVFVTECAVGKWDPARSGLLEATFGRYIPSWSSSAVL